MNYADPFARPPEHEPAPGWDQSLANGAAGIALLHAAYAAAGVGDRATVHRWVAAMTRAPVAAHSDASLFQGAPAVAFALRSIQHTHGHVAYAGPLATLDRHIATLTRRRLDQAHQRLDRGRFPRLREFDLINGLTGIGVYLLEADHTELARDVLIYLVRLTEPIVVDGHSWPGWWTRHGPADQPSPNWPGGHANLGLAHGIGGVLALLAAAIRCGITVVGQVDAIECIDNWLDDWCCGNPYRPWWPGTVSAAEWTSGRLTRPGPQRPSWCYGTPGLVRARQLAALALNNTRRRQQAETVLASCITDDTQLAQLRDCSLCHGWAGLVHITEQVAADAAPATPLADLLPQLRARWHDHADQRHRRVSGRHGMLEGAAGIALTQHTFDRDKSPPGRWDACLLTTSPRLQRLTRKESDDQRARHRAGRPA